MAESTAARAETFIEKSQESITEAFLRYFSVAFANSDEQKQAVFGIRYNVYCEEFGFEDVGERPQRLEQDEFDASSIHALITHRATGRPAACVRMVIPSPDIEVGLLPLEKHCADSLDTAFIKGLGIGRNTTCEISRLAVDGMFRRRPGETETRYGAIEGLDCTQQERRTFSLLAVACFLSATALTEITRRRNVFAMMEPFLPRLLQRSGIPFQRAGQDIDYHGLRAPYFTTTDSVVGNMRPELSELYFQILQRMRREFPG